MSTLTGVPIAHTDAINAKILAIFEDRIQEISPFAYVDFCRGLGIDPETMRE